MRVIAEKYQIIKKLGSGGTGEVYLVSHTDLGVKYALKILSESLSEDARFIERFKREASLLLRFSHPGTVQLRDFGRTDDGLYYLAMDFCEGALLKDILSDGRRFPADVSVELTLQLLDVLEAAHAKGVIHCDINPANIMIENYPEGPLQVKVLDFGTAAFKQGSDDESLLFGTPCYMAPEQASGAGSLDLKTDLYSAGVVLYELITGDVPFEAESVVETLLMHVTKPVPPFSPQLNVHRRFEEICLKALAKKPGHRFQSAKEFKETCEKALTLVNAERGKTNRPLVSLGEEAVVSSSSEESQPPDLPHTKILCLDDNEMILHILKHILEKEGYEVFTAEDSSTIHELLFEEKIDLLISDVCMPGMPGTKVCRLLKKSLSDLKVILFSNIPERDLERHSEENNADGWISKNTKPEDWIGTVRQILQAQ